MGSKGRTFQGRLIEYILGGTLGDPPFDGTPIETVYMALFTTVLADGSGLGGEVSTAGGSLYERVAYDNTSSGQWTGTNGTRANGVEIVFPTAGANWGTVNAFAILDVTTGGDETNILYYGNLTTPKAIDDGDTPKFEVGDLVITES